MTNRNKIVAGGAVALMLAGAGASLAGVGGGKAKLVAGTAKARAGALFLGRAMHGGPADDLQAAADYLGVSLATLQGDLQSGQTLAQVAGATSGKSVDGLVAALVAAEKTEIEAAVTAGNLTRAQADRMEANLQQRFTDLVNNARPLHPFGRGFGMHGGPADDLQAAADYLGVSPATLQGDLQSGQTLAQVAGAISGKSVDGLVSALVAAEKTEIEAAVTAGNLTRAQADRMEANLQQRFTDLVNNPRPARGPGFGRHGHGGGMGWGGGGNA